MTKFTFLASGWLATRPVSRGVAGITTLCAVALLNFGLSKLPTRQASAARWIEHTLQVEAEASTFAADMAIAISEGRGFVVDRTPDSLHRFDIASQQVTSDLANLRRLTADNPVQRLTLDRLDFLGAARFAFLRAVITHLRSGDEDGARRLIQTRHGRVVMDQVRSELRNFQAEEQRLLRVRRNHADQAWRMTTAALVGCGMLVTAGVLAAITLLIGRSRERMHVAALHERQATLDAVLDALPVGVILADASGRILRDNAANRALWGMPPETTAWEQYSAWIGWRPETGERIKAGEWGMTRALLHGELVTGELVECQQFHSTQRRFFLNNAAPIRNADGGVIGGIAVQQDVTEARLAELRLRDSEAQLRGLNAALEQRVEQALAERVQAEEQLRHGQKMEAIGRVAAGVAHDFNNILQSVLGSLELVSHHTNPNSREHTLVNLALQATKRGSYLTHHLLSYARKQVLQPQSVAPAPFLADLQIILSRSLGKHIVVEVVVEPDVSAIHVDPNQLQTALLNLAINAKHAMPNGGCLRLGASPATDDSTYVVISVTDTGVGMDENTLAQVCEPFYTTKGVEGTGLGLSMVQGFARQSGGQIQITSALGHGTTVALRLPVAAGGSEPEAPVNTAAVTPADGTVLLVDDDPDVLIITSAFLEDAALRVVCARSGDEALALLAGGEQFDALVTDYAMPGLNGADLAIESQAICPGLPVLVMTGFAGIATTQQELPECVQVLHKPFPQKELVAALHRSMHRSNATVP